MRVPQTGPSLSGRKGSVDEDTRSFEMNACFFFFLACASSALVEPLSFLACRGMGAEGGDEVSVTHEASHADNNSK